MTYILDEQIIVSTDLDGTLLDHYSYSWEAAMPALEYLAKKALPIVINTSKTFAEVAELQKALGIDAAFIVENGSAIYASQQSPLSNYFDSFDEHFKRKIFGVERAQVTATLSNIRSQLGFEFESYADWQVSDVIEHTGLSEEQAQLSLARQFSEPLIWKDSEEHFLHFSNEIQARGLNLIKGGRFIHVLGKSNKGIAIQKLKDILFPSEACSLICLGDSHNDLDMLKIADIPVFVRSPVHDFPNYSGRNEPIYTEGFGPEGWNEAIQKIFSH